MVNAAFDNEQYLQTQLSHGRQMTQLLQLYQVVLLPLKAQVLVQLPQQLQLTKLIMTLTVMLQLVVNNTSIADLPHVATSQF